MNIISLSLGSHWETFIKNEISKGHYPSATEVIKDALRTLEQNRIARLHTRLSQGTEQARSGEFIDGFSMDSLIIELNKEP